MTLPNEGFLGRDRRRIVVFQEQGRTYRAMNQQEKWVSRYQIDGGLLKVGKRCDYGMLYAEEAKEETMVLIELKGKDLSYAAEQINETLTSLRQHLENKVIHGRIVLSRVQIPDIKTTAVVRCQQALAKYQGRLCYKATLLEENI